MEKWSRFFSKYLRFTRYFSGTYLRWRLQKIVSPGPQHVINQGNQLNQRLHLKKSSKSALKVAKKVTTFIPKNPPWKNSPICFNPLSGCLLLMTHLFVLCNKHEFSLSFNLIDKKSLIKNASSKPNVKRVSPAYERVRGSDKREKFKSILRRFSPLLFSW